MAKRMSGGKNTLLNYFSPKSTNKSDENSLNRSNLQDPNSSPKTSKHKRDDGSSDDETIQNTKRRKRNFMLCDSSDSDNESDSQKKSYKKRNGNSSDHEASSSLQKFEIQRKSEQQPKKRAVTPEPKEIPEKILKQSVSSESTSSDLQPVQWAHDKLDFLKPEYIKDVKGRRPNHPDYDPRTICVPSDFLSKQTPAMRQWWVIKSTHFDCILFFKVGKFYELYHMDAVVGVNELGFSYMKGEFAHSGFPEIAYGRFSSSLVELGYKVARVEQTETPDMMQQRCSVKGTPKWDKVVKRELCQVTNRATQVNAIQDLDVKRTMPEYLFAIYEMIHDNIYVYGVCFVDTAVGKFYLGKLEDKEDRNGLLTLLTEHPPAAILTERGNLTASTNSLLKNAVGNIVFETLASNLEFYSPEKTVQIFESRDYFKNRNTGKWEPPQVLLDITEKDSSGKRIPKLDWELPLRSLGAIHWYLTNCLLDIQLFTIGSMEIYKSIPDLAVEAEGTEEHTMILDATSLANLHILGQTNTLQSTLDNCCTQFGKRLLKLWICRPLCNINSIVRRQKAIAELVNNPEVTKSFREMAATLPDLERQLSKIHSMGSYLRSKNHPDSRAIFYEEKQYSKKKIQNFMSTLNGFEKAIKILKVFTDFSSDLIVQNTNMSPKGKFPNIRETVKFFKTAFDQDKAEKEGKIIPQPGMDEEYDKTIRELEELKSKAADYLTQQEKFFGCKINYFGTDKKRFQLDVPESAVRKVTGAYQLEGAKKGSKPTKRYHTDFTRELLQDTLAAEKANREILQDLNRRIFEKFSSEYDKWIEAVNCLSNLDCLIALSEYTRNSPIELSTPEFVETDDEDMFLSIKNAVHPLVPNIESFVPNDILLGTPQCPSILMLTGPNMGGKSTLMRQVGVLSIMAQIGCDVPATKMKSSLINRIFTRLGAKDDIMSGQSTFYLELHEAVNILKLAHKRSLVLVDELGRGTSTFDGTAIAAAYINSLIKLNCRTIFSTHYYNVLEHFKKNTSVQFGHMACQKESDDSDATEETVTFMYKMKPGACPKSFGFNAARLAGIGHFITTRASTISNKIEIETDSRKMFGKMFYNTDGLRKVLEAIQLLKL